MKPLEDMFLKIGQNWKEISQTQLLERVKLLKYPTFPIMQHNAIFIF